jgi:hypothetical protein
VGDGVFVWLQIVRVRKQSRLSSVRGSRPSFALFFAIPWLQTGSNHAPPRPQQAPSRHDHTIANSVSHPNLVALAEEQDAE